MKLKIKEEKKIEDHVFYSEYARGFIASCVNIFITYPINKVSFRQQSHNLTIFQSMKSIYKDGIRNLYRGILPPFTQKCVSLSIMYGLYDSYFRLFSKVYPINQDHWYYRSMVGVCVGTTETFLVPFERMQTLLSIPEYNKKYRNTAHVFKDLIRNYGLKELYRGYIPCLIRNTVGNCFYFGIREPLALYLEEELKWSKRITQFITGCILGAIVSIINFPLNVMKTNMQKEIHSNVSLRRMFIIIYLQRYGFLGMYRGIAMTLVRSVLSWGIINLTYEVTKSYF